MSYTLHYIATFQNLPSLTLNAAVYDAANPTPNQVGDLITTGFSDYGYGTYGFWATLPDDHVGAFAMWDADNPSRRYVWAINPQEAEYNSSKPLTAYQTMIATEDGLSDYGAARTGDLSDFIGTGGANLTAIGDTRLDNLNATITSRLAIADYIAPDNATITAIAGYVDTEVAAIKAKTDNLPDSPASSGNVTSAQTAITDAISALNDITAADVVTAIMAYAVESGKDYATVLKEVYAILRGKFVADNATPTSIVYYAPDGTTARVTFAVTDTTRTPS